MTTLTSDMPVLLPINTEERIAAGESLIFIKSINRFLFTENCEKFCNERFNTTLEEIRLTHGGVDAHSALTLLTMIGDLNTLLNDDIAHRMLWAIINGYNAGLQNASLALPPTPAIYEFNTIGFGTKEAMFKRLRDLSAEAWDVVGYETFSTGKIRASALIRRDVRWAEYLGITEK